MIYLDSRYADGTIFTAYHSTKKAYQLTVFRKFPDTSSEFYYYEWVDGDRIESVANELFGDGEYWHQIMDFNPEIINPFSIAPGTLLRVPYAD
jgi:hypothetical protein